MPTTTVGSGCQVVHTKPSGPRGGGPAGPGPTCAIVLSAREEEVGAEERHDGEDDAGGDEERAHEQHGEELVVVAQVHEEGDDQRELHGAEDEDQGDEHVRREARHVQRADLDGGEDGQDHGHANVRLNGGVALVVGGGCVRGVARFHASASYGIR
jgi:hypothetical protein